MKKYLLKKWDDFIYKMLYPSLMRRLQYSPRMCYLFLLHLQNWLEYNPLSNKDKRAAENFFKEMNSHVERTTET